MYAAAAMNANVSVHSMPRTLYQADPRLSRFNPLPRILALDEFNTGTHGWVELLGNYDGRSNLDTRRRSHARLPTATVERV